MAFGDLTTLGGVKAWLQTGQNPFPDTDDTLLTSLVTAASQFIQTWLGRPIAMADWVEVRDGLGGQRLAFANNPVCAVLSLTIDGIEIPPVPEGSSFSAGYVFSPTELVVRGYVFTRRAQNVVLTYTAGYAAIPPELAQACIELVCQRYRERTRTGEVSKALGSGETVTLFAKRHERRRQDNPVAVSGGCAGVRICAAARGDGDRPGDIGGGAVMGATIEGLDGLAARLEAMPGKLTAALGEEAARLGDELRAAVERNLSGGVLQQKTGRLAGSIEMSVQRTGAAVSATVGTDVPYAAIHEYGGMIPAHEILPQSARALAFPWQGRERFFKRVELPAVQMPERSFLRSALAEMEPEIRAQMAAAVSRAVTA